MKVKCINHGNFKNITINREYEVSEVLDGFYLLVANDGLMRKYAVAYFEEIDNENNEKQQEAVAQAQIIPPKLIEYEISFDDEDDDYYAWVKIRIEHEKVIIDLSEDVCGSCGIVSANGISNLYLTLKNLIDNEGYGGDINKIFKKIILEVTYCIENNTEKGAILFSTNNNYPEIISFMDDICDESSKMFLNKSSGNNIKIWNFYINQ